MADYRVLGLYDTAAASANGIARLRELGIPENRITVMSGVPYEHEILGRHRPSRKFGLAGVLGAILGISLATFLTVGIFLLYPLVQGGQPIIPIPPSLIVYFEGTMLGMMWTTFFGLLLVNRWPVTTEPTYDPRITAGYIGVSALVDASLVDRAITALKDTGAEDTIRQEGGPVADRGFRRFWGGLTITLVVLTIIAVLFTYDIIRIPFPTNMADQWSIGYEQGPRLAAPPEAIPIQGPVLVAGQPASLPVPSDPNSLQRGKIMFGITCQICHGITGTGNGTLSGFFNPKPFDLTSAQVQNLKDSDIFLAITQGFGIMPPYAENMGINERWDVVNYVRSLKK